jgi:protein-disulfide isomerase
LQRKFEMLRAVSPIPSRRDALSLICAFPFIASARADDSQWYPIKSDDGAPVPNSRVPAELDPASVPGIVWRGPQSGDVVLYEFFDYNCPYCRKAAHDIEALVAKNPNLRLGLLNNAMLSPGSIQVAKVQQALLRLHGPKIAYDFHTRMFARKGQNDGLAALDVVRAMGLDAAKVEESADSDVVSSVLTRQARLASSLGMNVTPTFVVAGAALMGWPGAGALKAIVASAHKCGLPVCEKK